MSGPLLAFKNGIPQFGTFDGGTITNPLVVPAGNDSEMGIGIGDSLDGLYMSGDTMVLKVTGGTPAWTMRANGSNSCIFGQLLMVVWLGLNFLVTVSIFLILVKHVVSHLMQLRFNVEI